MKGSFAIWTNCILTHPPFETEVESASVPDCCGKQIFLIMQLYNPLYVLSVHHCVSAEYNGNTSTWHVSLRQGDTL